MFQLRWSHTRLLPAGRRPPPSSLPHTRWGPGVSQQTPKAEGPDGPGGAVPGARGALPQPAREAPHRGPAVCTRSPPGEAAKGAGSAGARGGEPGPGPSPATALAGRLPCTGEDSGSLSPGRRVLNSALKAQIILTTVPHLSPVLFGKQPLSRCTKRGFSRAPERRAWSVGPCTPQTRRPPLGSRGAAAVPVPGAESPLCPVPTAITSCEPGARFNPSHA